MENQTTQSPSSEPSPLSRLSGPDGKPLQSLPEPAARPMPNRREKYNMVFMMFTLMSREERRGLRKALKVMQPRLDLMYPNGMSEGDIKNDLAKAASEVVPDEEGHPEPENKEVAAELDIPIQPEDHKDGVEVAAADEEGC